MAGFLSDLAQIAEYAGNFIVALFQTMAQIFITTTTSGEGASAITTTHLSVFGILLLFSACVGLAIWIVDWIRGLITLRRG